MALERQITFSTGVTQPIDVQIEDFLKNNDVDPAAVQIVINNGTGVKTATLSYGDRNLLRQAYEEQGRAYSESDAVDYCHAKDIIVPFNENLDDVVNEFLADEKIAVVSISRYFTMANQCAFILYINLEEQKIKMEQKQEEVRKQQEELAQKFAQQAVKDVDISEENSVVDKYAQCTTDFGTSTEEAVQNVQENSKKIVEALKTDVPEEKTNEKNTQKGKSKGFLKRTK